MKFALIYGLFCGKPRGPYRTNALNTHGLTGSESFYFNTVKALAELGHSVDAFGYWEAPHTDGLIRYIPFEDGGVRMHVPDVKAYDVAVAWSEPDYLRVFPPTTLRICQQQLNDFPYCEEGFEKVTHGCPVPVVMAGGPKAETPIEVFNFVHDGIQKGAIGVNLGRNVWQDPHPLAMMKSLNQVIHGGLTPKQAQKLYDDISRGGKKAAPKGRRR